MAELEWFPFYAERWLASEAINLMLPEQIGAYVMLLARSWGDGKSAPSVPADDASLAQLSGLQKRWAKLGALVREQFTEAEGRLYNAKLSEVWSAQQERYSKLAKAGKKGGDTKAMNKQGPSIATQSLGKGLKHIEVDVEEAVEAPKGLLPASAPNGALALEGARAPALLNDGSSRAWVADEPIDPEGVRLAGEYFERLQQRVEQWASTNPDDAIELDQSLRTEMGLPHKQELTGFQHKAFRDRWLESVRALKGWPQSDEWIRIERARLVDHPIGNADRAANDASEAADD